MHQPCYKNLYTGEYLLPWVLLHGTKDYLDMVLITEEFEKIRQNFNLVPSLIVQIFDYAKGEADDLYLRVFRKPADSLSHSEKIFILRNFFNSNWENMIGPYPRYFQLLKKRGFYYSKEEISEIAEKFTVEDFRDLQVLFFLSWIDPTFFEEMEELKYLKRKGKFFTEEDKGILEAAQRRIIERIIPTYRRLGEKGKIEISTSPFYHPILPLIIDTDTAKESMPDVALPKRRFSYPEDAKVQVRKAKELFFQVFGSYPKGMWPPEGSVSDAACEIYMEEGVNWLATDESILFRTLKLDVLRSPLGNEIYPEVLYKPYFYERGGKRIGLIFRDRVLSDLISFHYFRLEPKEAVSDFMRRIREIKRCVEGKIKNPCVLIAMDGENAWEAYKNDGRDFLLYLYESISKEDFLHPTTVSSYMENATDYGFLRYIFPGSWINQNFKIWIGHEEDNTAWYLLAKTREFLEKEDPERKNVNAWESIYIAEGSDWNWWYGDDHSSENDEVFDQLFRENLINVYRFLNKEPPEELNVPILLEDREVKPKCEPTSFIYPVIDGRVTNYFEWIGAGFFESKVSGGAMHDHFCLFKSLYFGFNQDSFFLRVDVEKGFLEQKEDVKLELNLLASRKQILTYDLKREILESPFPAKAKFFEIFEVQIPRAVFEGEKTLLLWCTLKIDGKTYDRMPKKGYLLLDLPHENFEAEMWYV